MTVLTRPRIYQVALLGIICLWFARYQPTLLAYTCGNSVCETAGGENELNCPADCEAICGNNVCEDGETCSSCTEDCESQCVCGDQICNTPAEFGGAGSPNEPECNPHTSNECSYCSSDCGGCEPQFCDPQVCADAYGQCRNCQSTSECYFSDEYCAFWGQCEITDNCSQSWECPNYPEDFCDTTQNPGVCVPVT